MRILIISDSHGRVGSVIKAIEDQKDAKHIFFLGDRLEDIEGLEQLFPDRIFHAVSGNCDYNSFVKSSDTIVLDNIKILFTHGHGYSVKSGITRLREVAGQVAAKLVLYGHTHIANTEYVDGVYFVNPGSVSQAREGRASYAVIDIEKGGIRPIIIEI